MINQSKSNPNFIILLVICCVAVVIAFIAVLVLNQAKPVSFENSSNESTELPQLVSSIDTKLKSSYSDLQDTKSPNQISEGYPVSGYAFSVIIPKSNAIAVLTDAQSTSESTIFNYLNSTVASISVMLAKEGFVKLQNSSPKDSNLSDMVFYRSGSSGCQLTVYSELVLTCAPLKQLYSIASTANPLFNSYVDAAPASGDNSVANPTIISSKTSGYTIATMNIFNNYGETAANFYQQNSSGWQLVNLKWYNDPQEDGNILPNCQDFESVPTIRLAFSGVACYDSSNRASSKIN